MFRKKIKICDTTLRDGEQMPGVVFSPKEKLELARKSAAFGCHIIEIMPAISKTEQDITKSLIKLGLEAEITASTMLKREHVDVALDCGVGNVTLFTPVSDLHLKAKLGITREENLRRALEMVDYCREHGLRVNFAGEDATRADLSYLTDFIRKMKGKIGYFLPCDTVGCLTPDQTEAFIRTIKKKCKCPIALHIHNDFALSTANTLAGLAAGAEIFSGTFCGIGERAGNAPIEEVVAALRYLLGVKLNIRYELIGELCTLVERYSGVGLQSHKPLVGQNAFAHESGIHVHGMLKDPRTYENFDPLEIGLQRKLLLGKHSGKAILRHLLGDIPEQEYEHILEQIKLRAEYERRSFLPEEVFGVGTGEV